LFMMFWRNFEVPDIASIHELGVLGTAKAYPYNEHIYQLLSEPRLPLKGGLHMKICVFRCECGTTYGFPADNLKLVFDFGTKKKREIPKKGLSRSSDPPGYR
jgi:hypothetical protein